MRPTTTSLLLAVTTLALLTACRDIASPPAYVAPPTNGQQRRAVGLMEITITGIRNGSQPVASARAIGIPGIRSNPADLADRALSPARTGNAATCTSCGRAIDPIAEGDGTVQLEPLSTSTFTTGTRTSGGWRYVSATYRVRNAPEAGGTGYTNPRENLTFIAVNQNSGTLSGTNISQLYKFDGTAASTAIAAQMIPTGLATLDASGKIVSTGADVLQLYTEAEVG